MTNNAGVSTILASLGTCVCLGQMLRSSLVEYFSKKTVLVNAPTSMIMSIPQTCCLFETQYNPTTGLHRDSVRVLFWQRLPDGRHSINRLL